MTKPRYFILTILMILLPISASYSANKVSSETLKMLDLFGDIFDKVKKDYVKESSDKELIEAAINGMLTSLDPHSGYLNEKAFEEMRIQTKGEFGGLGIEITMDNGIVKVISPIDDTPAYNAGVKAGDYIININDESVMGMTLTEAVKKMRGKAGTKIKITVLREGKSEPIEFTITREIIKSKAVKTWTEEGVAYVRVNSFIEHIAENVKTELNKIKTAKGKNIKGIILDLRNNPGGLLEQAIALSDLFLNNGEIVSTKGRNESSIVRYTANKGEIWPDLPMVVLINGGSASASEIVAGALQDHKRAIIMGTKSFGKGSVQMVIPINDHGAIKLTTSLYYTPAGRSIQAEGINPDITVEPANVEFVEAKDIRKYYSEASLKGHIANGKKHDHKKSPEVIKEEKIETTKVTVKTDEQRLYEKDYQLARAIDLLKAMSIMQKR